MYFRRYVCVTVDAQYSRSQLGENVHPPLPVLQGPHPNHSGGGGGGGGGGGPPLPVLQGPHHNHSAIQLHGSTSHIIVYKHNVFAFLMLSQIRNSDNFIFLPLNFTHHIALFALLF